LYQIAVLVLLGFSSGVVIGSALAAFITLLDIIPRLADITCSSKYMHLYEKIILISVVAASLVSIFEINFSMNKIFAIPIGLVMGMYIGLLAAALAEAVNVIPVLARRLDIDEYVYYVIAAIAVGKVIGSLSQWILSIGSK
jgi:stage V sporulation protein AB